MTDPTARALRLLGLLQTTAVWSGAELAQRLGVTTRTVRRDVDRLRSLGYTVQADTGSGGGYVLGRGQILPPLLLDNAEATAVTLALNAAAAVSSGVDGEATLRALGKLDDFMPSALRRRVHGLRETMDLMPARPAADVAVLTTCAEATRRTLRLQFSYRDRHGVTSARTVEPHRLTARRGTWRLTAYDQDREDWRTFRLDRIANPHISTWRFAPRPGLADALARLGQPPPASAWRHQVIVNLYAPYQSVAEDMPYRADQLRWLDDQTTEFTTGADDPESAAWWLAGLRYNLTVVGDDEVRDAVARLGRRLTAAAN